MWKKFSVIALAVAGLGFALAPRVHAGTEMVEPNTAPAPRYNYAPPPPRPVYYAPPRVRVVVYPTIFPAFGYYGPRFGVYGYHRGYSRGGHWRSHHWR